LRVLTLCGSNAEVDEQSMIALLGKFRIEFSSVKVIEVLKQKLHPDMYVLVGRSLGFLNIVS